MGNMNIVGLIIIAIILILFILSIVVTIILSIKYSNFEKELHNEESRRNLKFHNNVLDSILKSFQLAASNNQEANTQVIIENAFNSKLNKWIFGERFVKRSVSLMIVLGLLGTFFGLTLSIDKLIVFLQQTDFDSLETIISGLINSVEGMAVAFVTSLFGIGCSIIITIVNTIYSIQQKRINTMTEIEEYLDNYVANVVRQSQPTEYDKVVKALQFAFKDFGGRMQRDFRATAESIAGNLVASTASVETAASGFSNAIQEFNTSLNRFNDNARDFSEFNYQLRTNIERMDIAFSDFSSELKKQAYYLESQSRTLKDRA